jgi:hypothetical protein
MHFIYTNDKTQPKQMVTYVSRNGTHFRSYFMFISMKIYRGKYEFQRLPRSVTVHKTNNCSPAVKKKLPLYSTYTWRIVETVNDTNILTLSFTKERLQETTIYRLSTEAWIAQSFRNILCQWTKIRCVYTRHSLLSHVTGIRYYHPTQKALCFYVHIDLTKCPVMFDWIDAQAADGTKCQSLNQEYYSFFRYEEKISIRIM